MASYRFPNNQVCTFGWDNEQLPEFQGTYSLELEKKIRDNSDGYTKLEGF